MTIRFHLDENVDPALAMSLRRRGVDVTTSAESGLNGASDREQIAFARNHGRVVVTHDVDFLRLAKEGETHGGIVFCSFRSFSIGRATLGLVALWRHRSSEEMMGCLKFM